MMTENDREKQKMMATQEKERLEDVHAQHEYARMLDKQEQDRAEEFNNREKRA